MNLDLVKKYFQGKCNSKEIDDAEQFLKKDNELDLYLEKVWKEVPDKIAMNQIHFTPNAIKAKSKQAQNSKRGIIYFKRSLLIAASAVFCVLLSDAIYTKINTRLEHVIANENTDNSVSNYYLADGTTIWLQPHSSISYFGSFNKKERRVKLKGEAYFDVAKNAAKPFIVDMDEVTVTVLGTMFNVKSYDFEREIQLVLTEGSVNITLANNYKELVHVLPGELFSYNKMNKQYGLTKTETADKEMFTDNQIVFNNTSVEEAFLRIANRFSGQIDFSLLSQQEKQQKISGVISAKSMEAAVKQIGFIHNMKMEKKGLIYVIKK